MATMWTRTLIPTAREVPGEAEVPSHQLLLRAGLIHRLGSGVYSYLPLGWRCLQKIMGIVRRHMDDAGAIEVFLPALQPVELWERTGRRGDYGQNLFVVADRHGREQALGPTHEEVITDLVAAHVKSYRDLPLTLYQIQTKFRDEYRPRFGVLRSREFQMKDAYSFDLNLAGLDRSYQAMYDAYCRIFDECGLPYEIVEAESGPIGGSASHEFMVTSPNGEDLVLKSDKGNYAANVQKCGIGLRPATPGEPFAGEPTGALEKVPTPSCASIEQVTAHFKKALGSKLSPRHMLKTLVFELDGDLAERWSPFVVAVVRGDHQVNEAKLAAHLRGAEQVAGSIAMADGQASARGGFAIGYVGPQALAGRQDCSAVVDPDAAAGQFWVTGANEPDHHVKHFNWKRDVLEPAGCRIEAADIRNAVGSDPSPLNDGGTLRETKGIEVGHVFKLGTKYTEALGAEVLDEHNERRPLIMGCYGIGINRILAAAIERAGGHDDDGIIWTKSIAPFQILITPIKYEGQVREVADRLAAALEDAGRDVLIDDRPERPGVKFKDADLIGIPVRITIGDRTLKEDKVELKARRESEAQNVPVEQAAEAALRLLQEL
jgi:prolyl-tRNA synthetase